MSKFKEWHDKARCGFIGWNYNLLSQCGESSHRLLKIYCSAVLIIMTLWFTIGFVFSQRYIEVSSLWGRLLTGVVFATIVFFIERIIILHMGGKGLIWFRVVLALFMSVLGAFIFDQMVFRNDLENQVREIYRSRIKEEVDTKKLEMGMTIRNLQKETDSLNAEITLRPYVTITDVTTTTLPPDSLGNRQQQTTVSRRQVPNPLNEQVDFNQKRIIELLKEQAEYSTTNYIENELENLIKNHKTGFLEELKASWHVITESAISIVFYIILACVLLLIEMFVVSLKFFKSKKCEYELIIEHQRDAKEVQLKNQWREISKKYVTQTLEN